MTQPTPAPWKHRWHNGFILVESGSMEVACIDPGILTARPIADARLIAAAPDLLAALIALTSPISSEEEDAEAHQLARAAIAKATSIP